MSTTTAPTSEQVRDDVVSWIAASWSTDLTLREWWRRLADEGWAFPHWPVGYGGRGLPPEAARVVGERLTAAGALAAPFGLGQTPVRPRARAAAPLHGRCPDRLP